MVKIINTIVSSPKIEYIYTWPWDMRVKTHERTGLVKVIKSLGNIQSISSFTWPSIKRESFSPFLFSVLTLLAFLKCCLPLTQELEALRRQVQSQSAEIQQLQTEKQDMLRRSEAALVNILPVWDVLVVGCMIIILSE